MSFSAAIAAFVGHVPYIVAMHAVSKDTTGDVWIVRSKYWQRNGKTEIISLSPFAKTKEVCRPCGEPSHITSQPFLSLE